MVLPPILVTGAHRSGTTWVGRMIARSRSVVYVHEPFHIHHHPGVCGAEFLKWFTYICDENADDYYTDIKKCIDLRYNLAAEIKAGNLSGQWRRVVRQYNKYLFYRFLRARAVVKNPIALFSAEWLAKAFNMGVVVMIRHPAAFAGSLKKAGWTHPFVHFLEQPLLMRDYLSDFKDEIGYFTATQQPIIDQAVLLWKLTHSVILRFQERHPDWIFVRHEDISRDPNFFFKDIFARLSLPWNPELDQIVTTHSRSGNPVELSAGQNMFIRDSIANIESWKSRLTKPEIQKIHDGVKSLSRCFYTEDEW